MRDEHTVHLRVFVASAYIEVPATRLSVLQHVEFVRILFVNHFVGFPFLVIVVQIVRACRVECEFLWLERVERVEFCPSHELPFVGRVVAWAVSLVAVAAGVHQVPVVHAVSHVVGVVEVGQAECVTELVAEHADSVGLSFVSLVAASIASVFCAVDRSSCAALLRPYGVGVVASVLTFSGINEERHVHRVVVVVVEGAPVGVHSLGGLNCVAVEGGEAGVFRRTVLSVVHIAFVEGHRPDNDELRRELSVALVTEIFGDGSMASSLGVVLPVAQSVAELIVKLVDEHLIVFRVAFVGVTVAVFESAGEFLVGELNENNWYLGTSECLERCRLLRS